MGDRFRSDETNPRGFFEDLWFKENNQALIAGKLGFKDWARSLETLLIERRSRCIPWGLKDPRTAALLPHFDPYFKFTRVIRCVRKEHDAVASMRRCYGWTEEEARTVFRDRNNNLDALEPILTVCVDNNPTEDDVLNMLRKVIHD